MLTAVDVSLSLLILTVFSFPLGYLILNTFQNKKISKIPFFCLFPLYLAVGISTHLLICFLSGLYIISAIIPVLTTSFAGAVFLVLVYKRKIDFSIYETFSDHKFANIFCIVLLALLYLYFSIIPISLQWPPVGDAIFHSIITSLLIHNGHIGTTLIPLDTFPHPYPTGYHVFSAELSLLLGINPAESVFLFGTYLVVLVSALLFSLSFVLTKSYWISSPIPFSILVAHSSGHLGRWLGGFIYNGPYPNLFGFVALTSIIILLQIAYYNRQSLSKISTILIVISLALLVTYPSYLFLSAIFIGVYSILEKLNNRFTSNKTLYRKTTLHWYAKKTARIEFLIQLKSLLYPDAKPPLIKQTMGIKPAETPAVSTNNHFVLKANIFVLSIFITFFIAGGLIQFYYNMVTYFSSEFEKNQYMPWLNKDVIWSNFASDPFYKILLAVTIASSLALMILKFELIPIVIGWALLFISVVLLGFNFIVPQRTLAFVSGLSWPIIAYIFFEIISIISQKKSMPILKIVITLTFVVGSFYLIIPHGISNLTHPPGWFLTKTMSDFKGAYEAATWLKNNVNYSEPILNDRSYASFYIQGFSFLNLTHNYFNGYTKPMQKYLTAKDLEPRELNNIWKHPEQGHLVYSLLKKYNVRYIVLMEGGYADFANWGGSGKKLVQKNNSEYQKLFNSYPFLQLKYQKGGSAIYFVKNTQ